MVRLNRRDDTVIGPLGKYCCKILDANNNETKICIDIAGMLAKI